jgi:uncharacterized protein
VKLFNDYNSYLRSRFGCKVYRVGLDAGFTCPTRDGTKGTGGCLYCDERGSRASYANPELTVREQLASRIQYLKESSGAKKFIAYFQAFTNTYAPIKTLQAVYDEVLGFKDVVGLSIGTRPDAVDREKLELVASYKEKLDVWMEYGLQSVHDRTLLSIKRGHSFSDFINALELTKLYKLPVSVHMILGLPRETREDMIESARRLTELKIEAVKIHLLHILEGSLLEKLYTEGKIKLLDEDEYVGLVCDFLENLSPDIIVERLTGEGAKDNHLAPAWALNKIKTIDRVKDLLRSRGTFQGSKYGQAIYSCPLSTRRS